MATPIAEQPAIAARHDAGALLLYLWAAVCFFALGLLAHPASGYFGRGPDASQSMWYLEWWPWAILHGRNPLYTHVAWSPGGYNLTWATSSGAASLLLAPITLAFGPVVSFNILILLAPPFTAWTGYWLCRHLTRSFWPSVAGGSVIGFSSYEMGHMAVGQLHLTLFFLPPLLILLALRFLEGTLGTRRFVASFTALLAAQFLISTEVLATSTVCGGIALVLAAVLYREQRRQIGRLSVMIAASYAACAIALSPVLYWTLAFGVPREPMFPPTLFSTDLLGPLIPGPFMTFAPASALALAARFVVDTFPWENGTYVGLPLLAVTAAFCISRWRQKTGELIGGFLAIVFVLSVGPVLHVAGKPLWPMPWAAAVRIPLLDNVLPVRLMAFALIPVAVAFATLLADQSISLRIRATAAVVCMLSVMPRPLPQLISRVNTPEFFARGLYRQFLARDANVLVIPYGRNGASMLWQAQSGMYFRMAGGYFNLIPAEFRRWPIVNTLCAGMPVADPAEQLQAFLVAKQVDAIVVAGGDPRWSDLIASLGTRSREIGGVELYDLRNRTRGADRSPDAAELEGRADSAWFRELILAAGKYLVDGGTLDQLSLAQLQQRGLVPAAQWSSSLESLRADWLHGVANGLWVGAGRDGTVEIGLNGSRSAIQPLIRMYRARARAIYYPYPRKFSETLADDDRTNFLMMSFSADQIRNSAVTEGYR